MSTIFALFVLLISSNVIFGLNRRVRATPGETTGHSTTDKNAVADYISQKIKGVEQATEFNGNINFNPGNVPNQGSGNAFGAQSYAKSQPAQSGSGISGQFNYNYKSSPNSGAVPVNRVNPANPSAFDTNHHTAKENTLTKKINNLKPSEVDQGTMSDSSSQKPDGYAMRISEESIEIDATIDTSKIKGNSHDEHINKNAAGESKSGYSDLVEVSDTEKNLQKTGRPEMGEEALSEDSVTTMDPVDEEIRHVLEALPKLPELSFSNNNTRFVFHKDPEEAALDDRITQVARQLAENSLRRHYEEQKLGHYIPIRLRHFDEQYPPNAFSSSRKLNADKIYNNALDILRQLQQPQIRFRALTIPQHIYNRPLYRSKDEPFQNQKKLQLSNSMEPAYWTDVDNNNRMAVTPIFNPNSFGAILQLGPHYVLPIPKVSLEQNRIPLFFDMSQIKPEGSFNNQNDLNTFSYREVA